MCDYPFFIPQVVLFANSSLFWFKVTNEHREFRNYLFVTVHSIHSNLYFSLLYNTLSFFSRIILSYFNMHLSSAQPHSGSSPG